MESRLDQGIASELEAKRTEIESLCRRTNVVSLDLFGSAASRKFRAEASDLDFLVTFAEFTQGGIFDAYMDLAEGLEALFGRKVDLVTERSIRNPYFRKAVEASRVKVYDRRNPQAPVWLLEAGPTIQEFVQRMTLAAYLADLRTRSAVERQFEILGEAFVRLRETDAETFVQSRQTARIIGFRNRLIHGSI